MEVIFGDVLAKSDFMCLSGFLTVNISVAVSGTISFFVALY